MNSATNSEGAPIPKRGTRRLAGSREINEAEKSILQMAGFVWMGNVWEISVWEISDWPIYDGSYFQRVQVLLRGRYYEVHRKSFGYIRIPPLEIYVKHNKTISTIVSETLDGFYFLAEVDIFEVGDPVWARERDD